MKTFRALLSLAFVLFLSSALLADGMIIVRPPYPPPHPIPPHPPRPWPQPPVYRFAPLEIQYHRVEVTIKDQVAVTEVDQVFYNPNNARLEGDYIFPLPKGAEIDKFSMDVNGKQQEAELLDADKARQIYTDIVRQAKDPALMEYADRGMFKVRIFPIEPHGKKQVKIKYTQVLKSDANLIGYTYPLNTEKFSAARIPEVAIKCTIDSQEPIKTLYSPSHPIDISRKGQHQAVVGWETKNAKPDTDFQLFYSVQPQKKGDIGVNLLAFNDGDKDGGHFMLFISPGVLGDKQVVGKKDVVFVMDTSGSMAGDKMEQATKALKFCIENLNDGDRFEVIRFSTEAESLFDGLREANKENRKKAIDFADSLKPIGGTAIEDALVTACKTVTKEANKDRPTQIIFLTDGRPTIGNTDEDQIVAAVAKQVGDRIVRVFCFGIGTDINTHLLDKITDKTKAASQYVLPNEDLEVKVSSFFSKINHPVLANVELKFKGDVKVTKMHPTTLPDVFKGDQLIVLGRYSGKAGENTDAAIELTGLVGGERKTLVAEATFANKAAEHTFVPRLWATRRVGYLLEQSRLSSIDAEVKNEITQLAKQYGIVTPYTSYLILEDETRRPHPATPRLSALPADAPATRQALQEGEAAAKELRDDKSGAPAVGGAKADQALKSANAPGQAIAQADRDARRGLGAGKPADNASFFGRPVADADGTGGGGATPIHITKFVAGRTFYFNGTTWVDSLTQDKAHAAAKKVQVKFGSDDYFNLLAKHKDAGAWFALGTQVVVVLDGAIVEVTAE